MPEAFWIEEYRKKAALGDAVAQSGRGSTFDAVSFLHAVRDVVRRLEVGPAHDVLDVGCANGLVDVLLSTGCRSLLALEPVPEQVELARRNLEGCGNVRVEVGHGAAVPAPDRAFDRVLMMGVVQLVAPAEVQAILVELFRVCRPGARVLVGSVPDGAQRAAFLEPYLQGVRQAAHLEEAKKAEIIARNEAAHWYRAEELGGWWPGARWERLPLPARDPDASHRYHLLLQA